MKSVSGRSLRPSACSCERGCVSREEMRERHGDPEAFLEALTRAFQAGDISFHEAERANLKYRAEWHKAPDKTNPANEGKNDDGR